MPRTPWNRQDRAPHEVLGVEPDATPSELQAAHRELAKRLHPDAGGSLEAMQELNVALAAALAGVDDRPITPRTPRPQPADARRARHVAAMRRDHPSFTVEALPAVAFEALVLAAASLGDVVGDDPPYLLQAVLTEPPVCWSQLELLPEAGGTSVTLSVGRTRGGPAVELDDVRDRWIAALNRLDWTDPASPQPPS